jgi:hypothetical protein
MKHLLLAILLVANLATFGTPKTSTVPVSVISNKRDIFYFKVDKTFIGAIIEVRNSEGVTILSDTITSHKAIVDFYLENAGTFTIEIRKDGEAVGFEYQKRDPLPAWCSDKDRSVTLTN